MEGFYSTNQVARILKIKPDTLSKAIWQGRLDPPMKSPSGCFLWTEQDLQRASWALLHRAYECPKGVASESD
jgi:hypothetical protein